MANKKLFREKSVEKISSPEQLNDYIVVTKPGVWMLLISIIIVLAGAVIWGFFGRLETRISVPAIVSDEGTFLYIKANEFSRVKLNQRVEIEDVTGRIVGLGYDDFAAGDILGDLTLNEAGYDEGTVVYDAEAKIDMQNGIYMADIVVDRVSPISFLTGNSD